MAWQWALYPAGHRDRRNLLVHVLTVPLFMLGTVLAVSGVRFGIRNTVAGVALMVAVMAAQGRTHRVEATGPAPFLGPLDVLGRILVEQWFTFPRFVLSGSFARAWHAAGTSAAPPRASSS